ncbi:hypothetical protein [Chromobacterium haemolyticum]|uniref:hypothetical protein n=1 Tax=Chromobacterium haemolyticum TaxID=394935 RepID=UPI00307EB126
MNKTLTACLLTALTLPATAAPAIHIGAMYDYFDAGKSTLLKRVRNSGTSTAFVKVSVAEIVYGSNGKPEEKPMSTEKLAQGELNGLVASPARLIVPAGGMQASRLLYMGPRDQERYYRVRFTPVLPDKQEQFAVSDSEAESYKSEMSAGVQVLTGYGGIVIVRPQQPHYDTLLQNEATTYTVRNQGNSTVVLDVFYDCAALLKDCGSPSKHHVRPGSSKTFSKAAGRSYKFELIEGANKREVQFGQLAKP